jgi:hypothetical protein
MQIISRTAPSGHIAALPLQALQHQYISLARFILPALSPARFIWPALSGIEYQGDTNGQRHVTDSTDITRLDGPGHWTGIYQV